jgi:hypothetical protein
MVPAGALGLVVGTPAAGRLGWVAGTSAGRVPGRVAGKFVGGRAIGFSGLGGR